MIFCCFGINLKNLSLDDQKITEIPIEIGGFKFRSLPVLRSLRLTHRKFEDVRSRKVVNEPFEDSFSQFKHACNVSALHGCIFYAASLCITYARFRTSPKKSSLAFSHLRFRSPNSSKSHCYEKLEYFAERWITFSNSRIHKPSNCKEFTFGIYSKFDVTVTCIFTGSCFYILVTHNKFYIALV